MNHSVSYTSLASMVLSGLLMSACSSGGGGGGCANGGYPGQCGNNGGGSVVDQEKPSCGEGYHSENGLCVRDSLICPDGQHAEGDQCVENLLTVQVASQSLCRVERNGATRFIVQFVARDENGQLVDPQLNSQSEPTQLASELYVDREAVDVESLLSRESNLLQSNLLLSLVLDSSYSMLHHSPPAFEPMKEAAVSILRDTQATWQNINSEFHWELAWFHEYIFRPAKDAGGNPWSIDDIYRIPPPAEGTFTGLYKAVHHMAGVHAERMAEGVAAGQRDQHIMVVLSDGKDNHFFFDNSSYRNEGNADGIHWTSFGAEPTSLADVQAALATIPRLRTHVIGLGTSVDTAELEAIAAAGNGKYFYGSSSNTLGELFEDVRKEFVTMQTLGVEVPLPPGEYEFSLRTRHVRNGAEGREYFTVEAGPDMPLCVDPVDET